MLTRTFWFVIVAALLGLVVAPALAMRACILFGAAEVVLLVSVLAFELCRGVQVLTIRRLLWSHRF